MKINRTLLLSLFAACNALAFPTDCLAQSGLTPRGQAIYARLRSLVPSETPAALLNPPPQPVVGFDGQTPDNLLRALGQGALPLLDSQERATVYDDGARRLRIPAGINATFKFADRRLIALAEKPVASQVSTDVAARKVREKLQSLGIPATEVWRVNPRAVRLDVANADTGESVLDMTVGHVVNVKRQVGGFPVLGSECQFVLEQRGEVSWLRCRWPTFLETTTTARSLDVALRSMSAQIDASLHPAQLAEQATISAGFVYSERVRHGVADYVPSLRVVLGYADEAREELLEPLSL
jgi:hypothetical protein